MQIVKHTAVFGSSIHLTAVHYVKYRGAHTYKYCNVLMSTYNVHTLRQKSLIGAKTLREWLLGANKVFQASSSTATLLSKIQSLLRYPTYEPLRESSTAPERTFT